MKCAISYGLVVCMTFVFGSCKKDNNAAYTIHGQVTDGDTGERLSQVEVIVEKQVIQNGIFGQTWINAASAQSASDGTYTCEWPRENFAALQVSTEKSNFIGIMKSLDVEAFKSADDFTVTTNLAMYKEGFITVNLRNAGVTNEQDRLAFTFLNAEFDCNCCSNFWRIFEGSTIDTALTCRIYGNRWLKYQVNSTIGFSDSTFVDSVYCPAFTTTEVQIEY